MKRFVDFADGPTAQQQSSGDVVNSVLSSSYDRVKGFKRFLPLQKRKKVGSAPHLSQHSEPQASIKSRSSDGLPHATHSPLQESEAVMRNRKGRGGEGLGSGGVVEEEGRREEDAGEAPQPSRHMQQLQQENKELAKELESTFDQVRLVEEQVAEIGALQETFASKVSSQAEEIQHLHHVTVESTENLNRAVDTLRKCATDSSDFRLFIIVFLVCMSFGLLILHWYH